MDQDNLEQFHPPQILGFLGELPPGIDLNKSLLSHCERALTKNYKTLVSLMTCMDLIGRVLQDLSSTWRCDS